MSFSISYKFKRLKRLKLLDVGILISLFPLIICEILLCSQTTQLYNLMLSTTLLESNFILRGLCCIVILFAMFLIVVTGIGMYELIKRLR